MADDPNRRNHPSNAHAEDRYAQPSSHTPQPHPHYPPPGETTRRSSEESRGNMAASVSLPSMSDQRASGYGPPPPSSGHAYPPDPRYASPNATNGYPPPGQQSGGYLPPLQPQSDPRSAGYRPQEQYGGARQPGQYSQEHQYPPHHDPYYYQRGPPPGPPGHPGYPYHPQGPGGMSYPEYGQPQGGAPPMAQAAPRQRTSIACKYCRKRKIRCSGYQSAPGGKCQNCARMNQECVFQPVSSATSQAFIPVSAIPGGVPPGTQTYGAYGQPLPPSNHPYPAGPPGPQPPPPAGYYQHPPPGGQPPGAHQAQQGPPAQSPAESSYSYNSARGDDGPQGARRRRRSSEDQDESYRLPPPRVGATEEEPRRRSPAEFSSNSSPGALGFPPYSRHPAPSQGAQPAHDGRSPAAHNGSSGASTPARQGQTPTTQSSQQGSSVMSLSNMLSGEKNDIDRGMIDRLNRK